MARQHRLVVESMETVNLHSAVIGLSWKTAVQDLRDRAFIATEDEDLFVAALVAVTGIDSAVVLSTCNRVEIYFTDAHPESKVEALWQEWARFCSLSARDRDCVYVLCHEEAVTHLFQVATSVDSIVQGETQISSQIRDARLRAQGRGLSSFLQRLFQDALACSKRIRTATSLGEGTVSIASAAVQLASEQIDLSHVCVGIVGAGVMAEAAWRHFRANGVRRFKYTNRTASKFAPWIKEAPGSIIDYGNLAEILDCDIVLTAVRSSVLVIKASMLHGYRPLLLDISAPRVIAQDCATIEGVRLYGIDDLQAVVDKNRRNRADQADAASHLIAQEVARFSGWVRSRSVLGSVKDARERAHTIAHELVKRHSKHLERLAGTEDFELELDGFARLLANKLLHAPVHVANELASHGNEVAARAILDGLGGKES
jgi:glutamyl-tRNA reductase